MIDTKDLAEIGDILRRGLSSDETFTAILQLLERALPFDSATLFAYNEEEDRLVPVLQKGDDRVDLAGEVSFRRGRGLSGWVSNQKTPVILESLARCRPGRLKKFCSFVSMPLWVGEKLMGVLNLGHLKPQVYRQKESSDYATIASQLSLVMEKLILRAQLETQNQRLKTALRELKEAQSKLVEKERLAAIGEIVVTVNHKINNPLTSIIALSEVVNLMVESGNLRKAQENTKAILREAYRIQKVTCQLAGIASSDSTEYFGNVRMTCLPSDGHQPTHS